MRLLKKLLQNKVRSHWKDLRANAWTYYNFRAQKRLRSNLQLFKVLSLVQDKMKASKFYALSKIKEAMIVKV